jgi:hypothetical protein
MPNTLSRIAGPVNVANGTSTVFTGTATHTYTIRSIRIANNTAGSITIALGINGIASANMFLPVTSIAPGTSIQDDGTFVMSGTETLQASTSATGLTITVSGLDQS